MAILAFQKPENVVKVELSEEVKKYLEEEEHKHELAARFEFKPLEPGYAMTVGNALRRILLSSLEGYAIASIRIDGVEHEFATIPGVTEDVTNIILNLKKIRFKQKIDNADEEVVTVSFPAGKNVFTAADLSEALTNFEVTNLQQTICHFDPQVAGNVKIEFRINKGRGYVPSDENRREGDPVNTIAIDSIYTPILRVMFKEDKCRIEQKTDYDRLILEVLTDGTIEPEMALREAAKILIEHFSMFSDGEMQVEESDGEAGDVMDEETIRVRQMLRQELDSFNLSVRARNCLRSNNVFSLADLVKHNRQELLKFRNFGKKTFEELEAFLAEIGLEFATDLSKYNLDKE
ncbi:MAG: DNA-directed RNA polymerase subunit alpha [Bacteroidales bacterium]|nr:DNA-directed RNA polymerase subunit alpha [Porphyromonas sp.]MDD6934316.1 DNA-directed RNA polymerase subunit alpha [Bacteroidales bacterium]MDY3101670.1 DNA-directed RNA polymerase subunit alpha [Porphyromonas sp.]